MSRTNDLLYQNLYKPCGQDDCSGVLMLYDGDVLCSEAITWLIRDNDEGGGG
jgi:hypothetical protein